MNKQTSRRRSQRIDLDPPEVGILFLKEDGYVSETNATLTSRQLFVDMMNRSTKGVGIRTEKKIEPATNFYLHAFNKVKKAWELFEGRTKWLFTDREKGIFHHVGAELKST